MSITVKLFRMEVSFPISARDRRHGPTEPEILTILNLNWTVQYDKPSVRNAFFFERRIFCKSVVPSCKYSNQGFAEKLFCLVYSLSLLPSYSEKK